MPNQLHYRTSIIGMLPDDWGKTKIDSKLVDNLGGFACARTNIVPSGIPHLRPFNITQNGQVILTDDTVHIPVDFRADLQQFYLEPGDVLYNNTNSVELVGKTGIVLESKKVTFSNHINRLRVKDKNQLHPKWLALILQQLQRSGFFANHCRKWIGQAGFSLSELSEVEIPLPYITVQRRIVARIEALFAEVREMRVLQADIEANTNRLMDTILAEAFSPSEIATWSNIEPLGNLAEITAPMVDPTLPDYGSLPHIYGATIEEGTGRLLDYNTAADDGMTSSKYHFQPGAVLYSKIRPYLRKATIVDFEGLCSADMYPLKLKNDALTPEFLLWSLLSPRFTGYANSLSGRARMPKLNRSQLFDYQIPYPSHEVQKRITAKLSAVRDEINEMRKSNKDDFERINQLEQAILAQAFRGEL